MAKPLPRGFTLTEMLIVIGIIAILAAVLSPVFAEARAKSPEAICQSNLKQLGLAVHLYTQDYDEHFPFGGWRPNFGQGQDGTWDWQNTIAPYLNNKRLFRCPLSTDLDEDPQDPTAWQWNRNPVSYLYNNYLCQQATSNPRSACLTREEVRTPADTWMLMDGHSDWGCDNNQCAGVDWLGRPNTLWLLDDTTMGSTGSLITGWLSWQGYTWGLPRHNSGSNVCLADGHVRWLRTTPSSRLRFNARNNAIFDGGDGRKGYFERTFPWIRTGDPSQSRAGWWTIN